MTQYYFDLKNGVTVRDHAGLDLESDAAAIAQAFVIADEISIRPSAHTQPERHIRVIHEDGHEVTRVPVCRSDRVRSAARLEERSQ